MERSRVIIYGLGEMFRAQRMFIESEFDCIGYSDKNVAKVDLGDMNHKKIFPYQLSEQEYDYIYVTSSKYADEIKKELHEKYGVMEQKMLTIEDVWWYVPNLEPRKNWIIGELEKIDDGQVLLDAGAGNRRYEKYCRHLRYISQDFGEYDDSPKTEGILGNEGWKSKECDIVCDITNIPLKDKSVDVILCSEVFEHIKNPLLALQEFSRLLRDDGILLLTAPFCSLTRMAPYYYANGFSRYWYEENLKDAGFEIEEYTTYGNWFNYIAKELERLPYMANRYGTPLSGGITSEKGGGKCIIDALRIFMEQSMCNKGSEEVLFLGAMVKARRR